MTYILAVRVLWVALGNSCLFLYEKTSWSLKIASLSTFDRPQHGFVWGNLLYTLGHAERYHMLAVVSVLHVYV